MSDEDMKADKSDSVPFVYHVHLSKEAFDILRPVIRSSPREVAFRLLSQDSLINEYAAYLTALDEVKP